MILYRILVLHYTDGRATPRDIARDDLAGRAYLERLAFEALLRPDVDHVEVTAPVIRTGMIGRGVA